MSTHSRFIDETGRVLLEGERAEWDPPGGKLPAGSKRQASPGKRVL